MTANLENARARIAGSGYSHPGYAARYNATRLATPFVGIEMLRQIARIRRPRLVVDLGAGTGLSTRPWAAYADRVIGVEPNPDMRQQAEEHPGTPANVSYRDAFSHATGLDDDSADVVTCHQALHWMEPEPTYAEVGRILRPCGAFAAYEHTVMPVALHWEVDRAMLEFERKAKAIRPLPGVEPVPENVKQRWMADGHRQRMQESALFQYVTELTFSHQTMGNVENLLAYCRAIGGVSRLLAAQRPEITALLESLRTKMEGLVGREPFPWLWQYRMWVGIR
jgi:ubiquinone/menaquinone biosynthesis C-methylase UbiE